MRSMTGCWVGRGGFLGFALPIIEIWHAKFRALGVQALKVHPSPPSSVFEDLPELVSVKHGNPAKSQSAHDFTLVFVQPASQSHIAQAAAGFFGGDGHQCVAEVHIYERAGDDLL